MPPTLDMNTLRELLDVEKQGELIAYVANFRDTHGPEWIAELCDTYPLLTDLIDLAANYDAADALAEISSRYGLLGAITSATYKNEITSFHGFLRAEIDKKR